MSPLGLSAIIESSKEEILPNIENEVYDDEKLLGLGFILAAFAVVTMGMVWFPKLDVNIWPYSPFSYLLSLLLKIS